MKDRLRMINTLDEKLDGYKYAIDKQDRLFNRGMGLILLGGAIIFGGCLHDDYYLREYKDITRKKNDIKFTIYCLESYRDNDIISNIYSSDEINTRLKGSKKYLDESVEIAKSDLKAIEASPEYKEYIEKKDKISPYTIGSVTLGISLILGSFLNFAVKTNRLYKNCMRNLKEYKGYVEGLK